MVSPEVKLAVDKIHEERDALKAAKAANELQASQLSDLKSQISALQVDRPLSDDDKKALLDAVNEAGETSDALAVAVPANVATSVPSAPAVPATPPPSDPDAPRPDPIPGTGQAGTVPLMPNSAFDPAGGVKPPMADAGQPNQAQAIETAGGFVIAGGGSVQRAPVADESPPAPLKDGGSQEAQSQEAALNQENAAREAGNGPGVPAGASIEPMQLQGDPNAGKPVAAL